MRRLFILSLLCCAALVLSGFGWGFGNDSCKEALELTSKLDTMRNDVEIRQAEAKILSLCPDGGAGHYVAAVQLERVGNIDGAIPEYRKALQQERNFPLASGNLGLLYAKKGMQDEAMVELSRGLAVLSKPAYHTAMARILAERKIYPLAIYHYNESLLASERDATVFIELADIYVATGQPEKALAKYRLAQTIDPGLVGAPLGIARIYLQQKEQTKALEALKQAEAIQPQNREIHLMMAEIYTKKGDATSAQYHALLGGVAQQSAAVQPSQATPPAAMGAALGNELETLKASIKEHPDSVVLYEKLGALYRSLDKDNEAIAAYQEAAHLKSSNSDVYLNLGILHEKQNRIDEAVVAYKQAIAVQPACADAHLRLADIRSSRGLYQEAATHYGDFLKLKPDSPDIQLKLARIFVRSKEATLAINSYLKVLQHSPANVDANRELAAIYRSQGDSEKAISHYKKALEQQKDDLETRNALVSLYVKNKQYDEITALLKGTTELFPDDPNNHYKLGLIYDFRKDYDNALACYKKAIELKPDHARSLNALGRLYMKTGRLEEARVALEAAKKADPNLEETTVLLNNIRDDFDPAPNKIVKRGKKGKLSKAKKGSKKSAVKKSGKKTSKKSKKQ